MEHDQHAGLVDADIDCQTTAAWLSWGIERTITQHVATHPDHDSDGRLATGIARGVWTVMTPPLRRFPR